jgi:multiple sugar transport system permease protein
MATVFQEGDALVKGWRWRWRPAPRSKRVKQQAKWGWLFLSPWIIGFLAFTLLPMLASLLFTFTDFNITQPDEISFVGFDNYRKLLTDSTTHISLLVTLRFAMIAMPVAIIQPILMAALLNSKNLWARRLFTTLFYMPYTVPLVSVIYIWQGVLNSQTGWLNRALAFVGLAGPEWLNSVFWIYPALVLIGLWTAGNAMLVTLAGMQGIPTALYEAAQIDGAGKMRSFFHITLPMITPVIFYNLILSLIGLFQYFTIPYILKRGTGEPGNATLFYNIYFYRTAFRFQDMGYGSTLAWLLFAIAITVTIILFVSSKYWVYSPGGDD